MFSRNFWRQATERAVKSGAQFVLLAWVGASTVAPEAVNAWTTQWNVLAGTFVGGAVFSYVTSLASVQVGGSEDPSLV